MRTALRRIACVLVLVLGVTVGFAACTQDVQLADLRTASVASPGTGGTGAGGTGGASVEQKPQNTPVFRHALCACEDAAFTGAFDADAFDSSVAAYAPGRSGANVGINRQFTATGGVDILGSLITTGTDPLTITAASFAVSSSMKANSDLTFLAGGAHIGGDLWVHGDILAAAPTTTVAGDVYQPLGQTGADAIAVGGSVLRQDFALENPCACGESDVLDVAAIVADGVARNDNTDLGVARDALYATSADAALELECGRFAFDAGTIVGDSHVIAHGRSALFIAGDLSIAGSFAPDLGASGEMEVFVQGDLILAPNAIIGSVDRPAALRLYIGGASDIALIGTAMLAAGVYAPKASLFVAGSLMTYGALSVASFYATGDHFLHYDSALQKPAQQAEACSAATPEGG